MNPDELRALADALEPMARAPRFEDFDVPAFCAWVRACADAEPVARIYTDGWQLVPVKPTREMLESTSWPGCAATDYEHMLAAAPPAEPCIGNDSACPCQDGDACHYKDAADGTKAWPVPQAEPKRSQTCLWSRADDDTDMWETACGNAFTLIEGSPADNEMTFCCFCGRELKGEIGDSDADN